VLLILFFLLIAATLLKSLKQLIALFLVNGYAFGGSVSIVGEGNGVSASGAQFSISLIAPATLWGGKILQMQGATLNNDFVLKVAIELVARAGYDIFSSSIKYDGTKEDINFTIR
jgi:hypothetical protein